MNENELAAFLSKAMADSGKSIAQLSQETGITKTTLYGIAKGTARDYRAKTIYGLMNALGLDPGELERMI